MSADSPVLELSKAEVVLVGRFVPDDVHPTKLVEANVIDPSDAKSATFNGLLKGQLVDFALDWTTVQAVGQRLVFASSQAPYVRIADLALRVVREALKAPVVTMLGINREYQYRFLSGVARDAFGTRLAPPEAWGDWGKAVRAEMKAHPSQPEKHGGLISMQMRQADLPDREAGWIDITIASAVVAESPLGAVIRVNDHYQCNDATDPQTLSKDGHESSRTVRLLDTLFNSFDRSMQRADAIVNGLVK
jgi:hypothetical protein